MKVVPFLVGLVLFAQPPLAKIVSPAPGAALGTSATFAWNAVSSTAYWFDIGNAFGQGDIALSTLQMMPANVLRILQTPLDASEWDALWDDDLGLQPRMGW